jgi:hypothetical protein
MKSTLTQQRFMFRVNFICKTLLLVFFFLFLFHSLACSSEVKEEALVLLFFTYQSVLPAASQIEKGIKSKFGEGHGVSHRMIDQPTNRMQMKALSKNGYPIYV